MRSQGNQGQSMHTEPPRPLQGLGFLVRGRSRTLWATLTKCLILITGSPLHRNLQVGNFQRHEGACHQHQARVSLQPALHLLLLVVLQPTISHLPFLLPSVSLLACPLDASPWMPAVVLYHSTFQGTPL